MRLGSTPSQTVGPYLHIGLTWDDGPHVVPPDTPGAVWLHGVVFDGAGEPVPDGLIETWQADQDGRFDHPDDPRGAVPGFRGFGRCPTGSDGSWRIRTVQPGALPGQAPHINVSLFARGMLTRVVTRIYFPDNEAANEHDPVLRSVPDVRRRTLIARSSAEGYRFDIRVQGTEETVFFDI
jgi:protocatechuate 3,4-dioxygenase alpha subunit